MSGLDLVEYIVENLVDQPEQVQLTEIPGSEETVIEVRVADSDIGKIIGKNGSVARSLRTLLSAAGTHEEKNYTLEIID